MKSEIYLLGKKIGKLTQRIERKTKIPVSWQRVQNDVVVTSKFFEMMSIILEFNKQNHTLLFNI